MHGNAQARVAVVIGSAIATAVGAPLLLNLLLGRSAIPLVFVSPFIGMAGGALAAAVNMSDTKRKTAAIIISSAIGTGLAGGTLAFGVVALAPDPQPQPLPFGGRTVFAVLSPFVSIAAGTLTAAVEACRDRRHRSGPVFKISLAAVLAFSVFGLSSLFWGTGSDNVSGIVLLLNIAGLVGITGVGGMLVCRGLMAYFSGARSQVEQ